MFKSIRRKWILSALIGIVSGLFTIFFIGCSAPEESIDSDGEINVMQKNLPQIQSMDNAFRWRRTGF